MRKTTLFFSAIVVLLAVSMFCASGMSAVTQIFTDHRQNVVDSSHPLFFDSEVEDETEILKSGDYSTKIVLYKSCDKLNRYITPVHNSSIGDPLSVSLRFRA